MRLDRGLSLRQMAEECGLQEWVIRSAETGQHVPQPRNARIIGDFYGVTVSDIWLPPEHREEAG
jgi:lambda repressor-like predicted transcriptional regulator